MKKKQQVTAKDQTIELLSAELMELRNNFQSLRKRALLSYAPADELERIVTENDDIRKELFYSLALAIKLNITLSGKSVYLDAPTLYSEVKGIHHSKWNDWLWKRLNS